MKAQFLGASAFAIVTALGTGQSLAQQFYAGVGYESLHFEITQGDPGYTEDNNAVSLLFGLRDSFSDKVWWAAELDYSKTSGSNTSFSNPSKAMRLRGLIGYDFGSVDAFGALGIVQQSSDYADYLTGYNGDDSVTGLTLGVGVQYEFTPKVSARLEYIYDTLGKDGFSYRGEWETGTVRAAAIFTF